MMTWRRLAWRCESIVGGLTGSMDFLRNRSPNVGTGAWGWVDAVVKFSCWMNKLST